MFGSNFARSAFSALGALLLTAAVVGAAAGPAHMVEAAPLVYAEASPQVGGGVNG